jgi:hypothetical protein
MTTFLASAGWVLGQAGGEFCVRGGREYPLAGPGLLEAIPGLFRYPIKNFGRFPGSVRETYTACGLALRAAGVEYGPGTRMPMGLIGAGYDATLVANRAFFSDYIDSGRIMGRGNLFIYTLPTSPLAEASIHFGMTGPVLYVEADTAPFAEMLRGACRMIRTGQAQAMGLVWQGGGATLCALLSSAPQAQPASACEVVLEQAEGWKSPREGTEYFRTVRPRQPCNPVSAP